MPYMPESRLQAYTAQINAAPAGGGPWQALAAVLVTDDWAVRRAAAVLESALRDILAAAEDEKRPAEYALGFIEARARAALDEAGAHA